MATKPGFRTTKTPEKTNKMTDKTTKRQLVILSLGISDAKLLEGFLAENNMDLKSRLAKIQQRISKALDRMGRSMGLLGPNMEAIVQASQEVIDEDASK